MAVMREPVRGSLPDPSFYALPGIERARGYNRDRAPRTPLHHLTGIRIRQVVNGSAVITMPASPWMAHPNGGFDVTGPAAAALEMAVLTVVPPRARLWSETFSYAQLRACSPESRIFIGRGSVVHTTPRRGFAEARVEDGDGRLLARASGFVAIEPMDLPDDLDEEPRTVAHPDHPTPDPHARSLPADRPRLFEHWADHGWRQSAPLLMEGALPPAPLHELFGIRLLEVTEGTTTTEMTASPWFQGLDDRVPSGVLLPFAIDLVGGASLSLIEPGFEAGVLDLSARIVRPVPTDGRRLAGTGRARAHHDGKFGVEVEVTDDDGPILELWATTVAVPLSGHPTVTRPKPVLTTVMFTDIVGSTDAADRLGDAKWAQVLDGHRVLVRSHIEQLGGREVNTTGDGFVATFDSPTAAVECGQAISREVGRLGIEVRVGIHTGECELIGRDITGTAVNVASRIEQCAGPGEVWFSHTVRDLLASGRFEVKDQGSHDLKGIPGEVWLHSLAAT